MLCPECQKPLVIVEFNQIELDTCPDCDGLWFDAQELHQLFTLVGASERLKQLEAQLDKLPHTTPRRNCPRCQGRLTPVQAAAASSELILDECPREHGIWFDQGELEALLRISLDPHIDTLAEVRAFLGQFISSGTLPRE